jgi:hypothetical protein
MGNLSQCSYFGSSTASAYSQRHNGEQPVSEAITQADANNTAHDTRDCTQQRDADRRSLSIVAERRSSSIVAERRSSTVVAERRSSSIVAERPSTTSRAANATSSCDGAN